MSLSSPRIRPLNHLAGRFSAEPVGPGRDTHSTQVQSVCIPASLQCWVAVGVAIGVKSAGLKEQVEPPVIEMDEASPEREAELGSPEPIESNVSRYATTEPAEFVAEMYTAHTVGRQMPKKLWKLYRQYGGPTPPGGYPD